MYQTSELFFVKKPLEKIQDCEPLSGEGQLPTVDGISRGQIVEFVFLNSSLRICLRIDTLVVNKKAPLTLLPVM